MPYHTRLNGYYGYFTYVEQSTYVYIMLLDIIRGVIPIYWYQVPVYILMIHLDEASSGLWASGLWPAACCWLACCSRPAALPRCIVSAVTAVVVSTCGSSSLLDTSRWVFIVPRTRTTISYDILRYLAIS